MSNTGSVPKVIKVIDEKPVRFFKKLKAFYRSEDLFSGLIPQLYKESEYQWAEYFEKFNSKDFPPTKGAFIGNIYRTLVKHYNYDDFDYGNLDYIEVALGLYNKYKKRIDKYMQKKFVAGEFANMDKPFHDKVVALREQVARGFIIDNNFKNDHKDEYYIKSTLAPDFVLPFAFNNFDDAYQYREMYGVRGYTGIYQPKHK